jgi:hypothetical protein
MAQYGKWKEVKNEREKTHYLYCIIGMYEGVVFINNHKEGIRYNAAIYSHHAHRRLLVLSFEGTELLITNAIAKVDVELREIICKELLAYNNFFGLCVIH